MFLFPISPFKILYVLYKLYTLSHLVNLPTLHCPGVNNFGLQTRANVKVFMSNWNLRPENAFLYTSSGGFQFFYCHKIGWESNTVITKNFIKSNLWWWVISFEGTEFERWSKNQMTFLQGNLSQPHPCEWRFSGSPHIKMKKRNRHEAK